MSIANDTSVGRTERVGLMSEQNQNLASDPSKKYTYRSEPKQISFRVSESEFAKLKQSAEALQMSVPAFVKAKAQNARLVTPKVAPDIAQAIARDLAKAGGISIKLLSGATHINMTLLLETPNAYPKT